MNCEYIFDFLNFDDVSSLNYLALANDFYEYILKNTIVYS